MAKFSPEVLEDSGKIRLGSSLHEMQGIVDGIIQRIEADIENRSEWERRLKNYYLRRYCRLFRKTDWPWPRASDIVMPTIDMTVDRLKSTLSRVIFTKPIVTFESHRADRFEAARKSELYFNWLLYQGMQDWRKQVLMGLDSVLQNGFGIFKIFWDTQTRVVKRIFRPSDLPVRYADLIPGLVRQETQNLFRADVQARFSPQAGRRIADNALEALRPRLAKDYLDIPESRLKDADPEDKKALDTMLRAVKSGREQVVYTTREYEYNGPRWLAVDPLDFIVPVSTWGIQGACRCVHRLWLTESTLKQRARDHGWSEKSIDQIIDQKEDERKKHQANLTRTLIDYERDFREGIMGRHDEDLIEVHEVYWKRDVNRDGVDEKIVGVFHPHTRTILKDPRMIPFEHGKYPFVQIKFENNDPRYYSSRGVPEKLDDIDVEITKRHRNKLNNMDLMVPAFTYRFGSELNPDNFAFRPGGMYPVVNHDDLAAIQVPDRTLQDEREENILLTWNQRYLGGLDTGLADQQNISEARTATEIQAIQRSAGETLSFRAIGLQIDFREGYNMTWDLECQYRDPDDPIYERVTGVMRERFTKAEIQGDYDIIPVGTLDTTDPILENQKALARYQLVLQAATVPPQIMGPEYEIKPGVALKRFLDRDHQMDSSVIMRARTPQEIQALQQQLAQRAELERRAAVNEELSEEEMREMVHEAKKVMPHGGRQKLRIGGRNGGVR